MALITPPNVIRPAADVVAGVGTVNVSVPRTGTGVLVAGVDKTVGAGVLNPGINPLVTVDSPSLPKWAGVSPVSQNLIFTVRRFNPGDTSSAITFDFATSDGGNDPAFDAILGVDYVNTFGSSSIPAGQQTVQISVVLLDSSFGTDPHRDFTMTLSNMPGPNVLTNGRSLDSLLHGMFESDLNRAEFYLSGADGDNYGITPAVQASLDGGSPKLTGGAVVITSDFHTGLACYESPLDDGQSQKGVKGVGFHGQLNMGDGFDGNRHFHRLWLKIDPTMEWTGSAQDKTKFIRIKNNSETSPQFATFDMKASGFGVNAFWGVSDFITLSIELDPKNGLERGSALTADLGANASDFREYILEILNPSAFGVADGHMKLSCNGQQAYQKLNMDFLNGTTPSIPDTTLRLGWAGGSTWFPQISLVGTPEPLVGGFLRNDEVSISRKYNSSEFINPF